MCEEQSRGLGGVTAPQLKTMGCRGHSSLWRCPLRAPSSPKMLVTLLSSSLSMMKSGTTCWCSVRALLEDLKSLLTNK